MQTYSRFPSVEILIVSLRRKTQRYLPNNHAIHSASMLLPFIFSGTGYGLNIVSSFRARFDYIFAPTLSTALRALPGADGKIFSSMIMQKMMFNNRRLFLSITLLALQTKRPKRARIRRVFGGLSLIASMTGTYFLFGVCPDLLMYVKVVTYGKIRCL